MWFPCSQSVWIPSGKNFCAMVGLVITVLFWLEGDTIILHPIGNSRRYCPDAVINLLIMTILDKRVYKMVTCPAAH